MSFHRSQLQPKKEKKTRGRQLPFTQTTECSMGYCQYMLTLIECERRINSCSPIASEIDVDFAIYVAITWIIKYFDSKLASIMNFPVLTRVEMRSHECSLTSM